MSVHCKDCGAIASYGHELGHRSDCPSLKRRPMTISKLRFTNEWLRKKIETDPDLDCEAGGPPLSNGDGK